MNEREVGRRPKNGPRELGKVRRLEPEDGAKPDGKKAIKALFKEHDSRAVMTPVQDPQPRFSTRPAEEVGRQLPYLETAATDKRKSLFRAAPLPALCDDVTRPSREQPVMSPVPVLRLAERVSPNTRIGKRPPLLVPLGSRS